MKIFVSGAAGFIGRHVISELSGRGHEVVGLAINEEEGKVVRNTGGKPVMGDLTVSGPWCGEIMNADKVISLTLPFKRGENIPQDKMEGYGRKHAEAVTNLIKAAAAGAARSVILTWDTQCYGDRKGRWVSDIDAIDPIGYCRPLESSFKAIEEITEEAEIPVVNFYPARVYGNGGWFKALVENMLSGKARMVEPGDNWISLIHVEDLALFYANAIEKLDQPAAFSISDDRPVRQDVLLAFLSDLLDTKTPPMVDFKKYAEMFGLMEAEAMSSSTRVPGINAIDTLDVFLEHRGYERGVADALKSMGIEPRKTLLRAA